MQKPSFWEGTHPWSDALGELENRLVPISGEAATPHGELLRCVARLYYDVYNSGFCNRARLAPMTETVLARKNLIRPFLRNPQSLTGLMTTLRRAGDEDPSSRAENGPADKLEDIVQAVIRYVAQADGFTLPAVASNA